MSLYLVQHGLSLGKDKDPEQGLSDVGISTTQRSAQLANNYNICSLLVSGSTEYLIFKFQNSGLVCLDQDTGSSFRYIKWALMPNIN